MLKISCWIPLLLVCFSVNAEMPTSMDNFDSYTLSKPQELPSLDPISNGTITPFSYPLYKQCDSKWGNDTMVTTTVCKVGCLMSSISMALAGHKINIDGAESNPGSLNKWLRTNNGYDYDNDLYESVIPNISPGHVFWAGPWIPTSLLSPTDVKGLLSNTKFIVIANVMHGHHFVLVTGYDSTETNFYVNDPGFDTAMYTLDSIVGWRLFTIV